MIFAMAILTTCAASAQLLFGLKRPPLSAKRFIDKAKNPEDRLGGSLATESVLRDSLDWLETNQQGDGGWDFASATRTLDQPGSDQSRVKATSLVMLTMMGWGITHKKTNERRNRDVAIGLTFLARQM